LLEVNEWSVRIQHLGQRRSFALATTNAEAAAIKARDPRPLGVVVNFLARIRATTHASVIALLMKA